MPSANATAVPSSLPTPLPTPLPSPVPSALFQQVKAGPDTSSTAAFVEATSKPCPQCSFRITHYHGHACHHIKPGTGCPNCGTHFCYRCLQRGTSGSVCGCRLFCVNEDIERHVALVPFPHDTRCGCTFCSDCRPGAPCSQCNGGCVVCRGVVPPGPSSADEIDSWAPGRFRGGDGDDDGAPAAGA